MADKKQSLVAGLTESSAKPQIRRGGGMRLSTEGAQAEPQESTVAPSQSSELAETQKRRNAETQKRDAGPKRVNRGYMLREDLIKKFKLLAVQEDRNLYEVMEEALEEYLARRREA